MLQYRPLTHPEDRRWYNPNRDLSNVGLQITIGGIKMLDAGVTQVDIKQWLNQQGIKDEDIEIAIKKLACAFDEIANKSLTEALEHSGFMEIPVPIRLLILHYVGLAFLDATFICVKDALFNSDKPPMTLEQFQTELAETLERFQYWRQPIIRIIFNWLRSKVLTDMPVETRKGDSRDEKTASAPEPAQSPLGGSDRAGEAAIAGEGRKEE